MTAASILRRWDAIAYEQACAAAARLADENEQLRRDLNWRRRSKR